MQLASREWEWDDKSLVNDGIGRCGKETRGESSRPFRRIRRFGLFRDRWQDCVKAVAGQSPDRSNENRVRESTGVDVISAIEAGDSQFFGSVDGECTPSESELEVVLEHLWNSTGSRVSSAHCSQCSPIGLSPSLMRA